MTQDAKIRELRDRGLAAIRSEKRIGPHFKPAHFDIDHRTVRLTGAVRSQAARDAAEWDAWYVFGVDDVVNELEVMP